MLDTSPRCLLYHRGMTSTYRMYQQFAARPLGKRAFSLAYMLKAPYFPCEVPVRVTAHLRDGTEVVRGVIPLWLSEARR